MHLSLCEFLHVCPGVKVPHENVPQMHAVYAHFRRYVQIPRRTLASRPSWERRRPGELPIRDLFHVAAIAANQSDCRI